MRSGLDVEGSGQELHPITIEAADIAEVVRRELQRLSRVRKWRLIICADLAQQNRERYQLHRGNGSVFMTGGRRWCSNRPLTGTTTRPAGGPEEGSDEGREDFTAFPARDPATPTAGGAHSQVVGFYPSLKGFHPVRKASGHRSGLELPCGERPLLKHLPLGHRLVNSLKVVAGVGSSGK